MPPIRYLSLPSIIPAVVIPLAIAVTNLIDAIGGNLVRRKAGIYHTAADIFFWISSDDVTQSQGNLSSSNPCTSTSRSHTLPSTTEIRFPTFSPRSTRLLSHIVFVRFRLLSESERSRVSPDAGNVSSAATFRSPSPGLSQTWSSTRAVLPPSTRTLLFEVQRTPSPTPSAVQHPILPPTHSTTPAQPSTSLDGVCDSPSSAKRCARTTTQSRLRRLRSTARERWVEERIGNPASL
ncbi:hypothetical protein C8F01DRAFT_1134431, partial [Mycena amicta]